MLGHHQAAVRPVVDLEDVGGREAVDGASPPAALERDQEHLVLQTRDREFGVVVHGERTRPFRQRGDLVVERTVEVGVRVGVGPGGYNVADDDGAGDVLAVGQEKREHVCVEDTCA